MKTRHNRQRYDGCDRGGSIRGDAIVGVILWVVVAALWLMAITHKA